MTPVPPGTDDAVTRVRSLLAARSATLGAGRLVCVDGPAGSGKTTLAAALSGATGATVLHVDDLLEGWTGLPTVSREISAILNALAAGRPARWRPWDWTTDRRGAEQALDPAALVVLEGVGAGGRDWSSLTTVLVWVEAAEDLRMRRGLARDGSTARAHWERWMVDEAALFAREGTRDRADVLLRTDGAAPGPATARGRREEER